jgi:hypothetical protein
MNKVKDKQARYLVLLGGLFYARRMVHEILTVK